MLSGLGSEAEEEEENKRAEWPRPTVELDAHDEPTVRMPRDGRNEPDATKIEVGVVPADPRIEWLGSCVEDHLEDSEWGSAQQFDTSEGHQTEVSAHRQS